MSNLSSLINAASFLVANGMDQLNVSPRGAYMIIVADGPKVYIHTDVEQGRFREFALWATENLDGLATPTATETMQ
jgi:hypothetical protein